MSSSRKRDSRYPNTRARSPQRHSRPHDRFYGSKRTETERLSGRENQQLGKRSNREDDDREVCMKKLSEFNDSLQRQGESASTKFQWDNLLHNNFGKAAAEEAATKPELAVQNARQLIRVSPMGTGLTSENRLIDSKLPPLNQMKSCLSNNGEYLQYPVVGSSGVISEAVGVGRYGENFGSDSSPLICEMAMNRIRKTEEATAVAYRKMESMIAKSSVVDSIIDKIDGPVENTALELDHGFSLPQQHMAEEKRELLRGERNQLKEDCGRHALTQGYPGFSGQAEEVVGFRMNHSQSPKGAFFHVERREDSCHALPQFYPDVIEKSHGNAMEQENESVRRRMNHAHNQNGMNHSQSAKGGFLHGERREDSSHGLPQFYPDVIEESRGNAMEQENESLPCRTNHAQNQNGAIDSQAFQHYTLSRKLHQMEQENEDLGSRTDRHHSQRRAWFHGEMKGLSEDDGHSLPQNSLDFARVSRVMEHANDIFNSRMTCPRPEKKALFSDGQQELAEGFGHSLPQHYLDSNVHHMQQKHEHHGFHFDVQSHQMHQEHELHGSRMNHLHKQKGEPWHGETRQQQENCARSLPQSHFGLSRETHLMEHENGVLASRVDHAQDQKGALFNGESQPLQQHCTLESYPPSKQDDDVRTTEISTQQLSATEELRTNSESSKTHSKKRIIDLRRIRESRINALPQTSDASDDKIRDFQYGGEQQSDEDFEQLLLLRSPGFQFPQDERAILLDELPNQSSINDCDYQISSPHMREFAQPANKKNIKQRLGPPVHYPKPSNRESNKQRLGSPCQVHPSRKSTKKSLISPSQMHSPNCMPRIGRQKNVIVIHEGMLAQDVDLPNVKRGRTEGSEEFKLLVHGAFLQFVKVLNENPAQRRKYMEKAETDSLKCCVCGSKSKEFASTVKLVVHAFTSQTVGLRVKHLGLHKALCLLMGWNSMAASNGLWMQKTLPDAEVLAVKEDLIIWPPVVILHNSSIATTNSDDRIIVSIEALEAFLIGLGFGQGTSKVCRGKPANQSIMTVIFHGTLSGLQEAERLHKLYVENKHGRAEFQLINWSKVAVDKAEDVLYGYMGIAGDLDKLDFETKSCAVIKSRKEIYGNADALLRTR